MHVVVVVVDVLGHRGVIGDDELPRHVGEVVGGVVGV